MDEIEQIKELLPGYSLGLLGPEGMARVELVLRDCQSCLDEIALYETVSANLLSAAPEVDPPAILRSRLHERIGLAPAPPAQPAKPIRPNQPSLFARLRAAWSRPVVQTVFALLLIGLIGSNFYLWQTRGIPPHGAQIPGGMTALPVLGTENAPEASAFAVISHDGESGMLVVEHLPELPPGMVYQVWLAIDAQGILDSGGLFGVDESGYGGWTLKAPLALDAYTRVGVTVEPEAGSSGPTGIKVLGADLAGGGSEAH